MIKRNWTTLANQQDNTVSVLTWNTLADGLAESGGFLNVKDSSILSWDNRKDKQLGVILEHNYDIICLQEVDHYHDWIEPCLNKAGYTGTLQQKYSDIGDGICVFWKKDKFTMIDDIKFRYIGSSQVGLIVVLESNANRTKKICVGTTHLKAKPEFHELRVNQGNVFLDALEHAVNKHHCPTFFAGDMNDEPDSNVIKAFRSKYTSVYPKNIWTTWKQRDHVIKRCIDYIFYDPFGLTPTSVLEIPSDKECPTMLPAPYYPSDHMAIGCRFKLT